MLKSLRDTTGLMGWLFLGVGAVALTGCMVESTQGGCDCGTGGYAGSGGNAGGGGAAGTGGSGGASGTVVKAVVDADQTLETTPGEGVGVFIEYAKGGTWHVYTACDTKLSNMPCVHNVSVTVPATSSFGNIQQEGLEGADTVYEYTDGLELAVDTSNDLDGVYFDTDSGATVRFETWLDGEPEGRFVYWVGGGAVHAGAPSNPLDLMPSEP